MCGVGRESAHVVARGASIGRGKSPRRRAQFRRHRQAAPSSVGAFESRCSITCTRTKKSGGKRRLSAHVGAAAHCAILMLCSRAAFSSGPTFPPPLPLAMSVPSTSAAAASPAPTTVSGAHTSPANVRVVRTGSSIGGAAPQLSRTSGVFAGSSQGLFFAPPAVIRSGNLAFSAEKPAVYPDVNDGVDILGPVPHSNYLQPPSMERQAYNFKVRRCHEATARWSIPPGCALVPPQTPPWPPHCPPRPSSSHAYTHRLDRAGRADCRVDQGGAPPERRRDEEARADDQDPHHVPPGPVHARADDRRAAEREARRQHQGTLPHVETAIAVRTDVDSLLPPSPFPRCRSMASSSTWTARRTGSV